jgi:hypothetical protein
MQTHASRRWLPPVIGLTLLSCAIGAHAATGARVVMQLWNPLEPDRENNTSVVDDPTLVSDSLQDAWTQARPKICEQLRLRMGVGGAARGETLSDITCLLDEQPALEVTPVGQNSLRATFAVGGYVEATSTTPEFFLGIGLGKYADPRFSVALTTKLDLVLAIQPDRNQTLRVSKAQFTIHNATLDSHNATGDLVKFVVGELVPFFGGPDYKAMAESAVNAVSEDFAADFNGALVSVNTVLKGPSDAVRVGVSGRGNYVSVAFAAREIEPPTNGRVTGLVRWDPAEFKPRNGCQSFDLRAVVQTGPVPLYASDKNPPTRKMGVFHAEPAGIGTCAFTLSGIAEGWPNVLASRVVDPPIVKNASNSNYRETYTLTKDGWDGRVVPQPTLNARNYRVRAHTLKMADMAVIDGPEHGAHLDKGYLTNPRFNPADVYAGQAANPAGVKTLPSRASDGISRQVETVSLNPQPLPPEQGPATRVPAQAVQAQATTGTAGTNAATTIGGKVSYRRVDVTAPATAAETATSP